MLGEGDDDAVDIESGDDLRQLRRPAEDVEVRKPVDPLPRVLVHEADDVDPVLGMLQELPGDALSDVAGADDERVQDVGVAFAGTGRARYARATGTRAIASTQKSASFGKLGFAKSRT